MSFCSTRVYEQAHLSATIDGIPNSLLIHMRVYIDDLTKNELDRLERLRNLRYTIK